MKIFKFVVEQVYTTKNSETLIRRDTTYLFSPIKMQLLNPMSKSAGISSLAVPCLVVLLTQHYLHWSATTWPSTMCSMLSSTRYTIPCASRYTMSCTSRYTTVSTLPSTNIKSSTHLL